MTEQFFDTYETHKLQPAYRPVKVGAFWGAEWTVQEAPNLAINFDALEKRAQEDPFAQQFTTIYAQTNSENIYRFQLAKSKMGLPYWEITSGRDNSRTTLGRHCPLATGLQFAFYAADDSYETRIITTNYITRIVLVSNGAAPAGTPQTDILTKFYDLPGQQQNIV
ncbi:MAG TPA: hypothetical protein VFQ63_01745 [Patescibacteria group bacterium]|nr:hypothetical protein [Patescibacteria group bacterium]